MCVRRRVATQRSRPVLFLARREHDTADGFPPSFKFPLSAPNMLYIQSVFWEESVTLLHYFVYGRLRLVEISLKRKGQGEDHENISGHPGNADRADDGGLPSQSGRRTSAGPAAKRRKCQRAWRWRTR